MFLEGEESRAVLLPGGSDVRVGGPDAEDKPAVVRRIIHAALRTGWRTQDRGTPLLLTWRDEALHPFSAAAKRATIDR